MNVRFFEHHWERVQDSKVPSLTSQLLKTIGDPNDVNTVFGLTGSGSFDLALAAIGVHLENISELLKEVIQKDDLLMVQESNDKTIERQLFALGMKFLEITRGGRYDLESFEAYIDAGLDVNFQDPQSGATALHIAAGHNAKLYVNKLIDSGRCDYLLLDRRLMLAHEHATIHSEESDICSRLFDLEENQMLSLGFDSYEDYVMSENGPWRLRDLARFGPEGP
ncbi:MAG: hypothetical protein Hals2KO_14910 [Halioglobus sp.]